MADNAFKVLVLPRGEAADISQFGTELQKICDKVKTAKIKVEADKSAVSSSVLAAVKLALHGVRFDVQFNAASIENSIKTALAGKTFDINVNPVVQQGGSGGGNGNGSGGSGNGGGGQPQQHRQQIGQRDTFARLVSGQVYLEGLKKKYNLSASGSVERSMYGQQIYQYSQSLNARKAAFNQANQTTMPDLNSAIKQTDQYAKAQLSAAEAAAKAESKYQNEYQSIANISTEMASSQQRMKQINEERNHWTVKNSPYAKALYQPEETDSQGNVTKARSGLLVEYADAWKKVQTQLRQIQEPTFQSKDVATRTQAVKTLEATYEEFRQKQQAVFKETEDFQNKTGNYKGGFFDEFVEGVGKKFGWAMMAAAAREARQALSQLYTNVVQLDGALTQISIVTGTSGDALKSFANDAANVAKEVGSTTSSIISSTETYARLGYTLQDSLNLADVTAQYANVAGVDVESATSSLTSIMKSFNVAPTEMEGVVDKLVKVGQEYAISAGELGEAMQRGGAAMAAGGATLDETIALFTAGRNACPAA